MTIVNHYGITVDSNVPITGVLLTTDPEWLPDDMLNGIDPAYEDYINEPITRIPDGEHYECEDPTYLIGYVKRECPVENITTYCPDETAEYTAIATSIYTQVIKSPFVSKTALCSPCCPGQGDLDTDGEFLAYTLPPDVFGEHSEHLEIFKLEELKL